MYITNYRQVKFIQNTLAILIIAAVFFSASINPSAMINSNAIEIKDINTASASARNSILSLAAKGIISGGEKGNFTPHEITTRAQIVKMIVNALGLDTSSAPDIPTFNDVPKGHWAYKFIESAYRKGIVKGGPSGSFRPNDPCTREQAAVMFINALRMKPENVARLGGGEAGIAKFKDGKKISKWAVDAVAVAYREGLMLGTGNSNYSPAGYVSREQMAVITDRFIKYKPRLSDLAMMVENVQVSIYSNQFVFYFNKPVRGVVVESVTDSKGNEIDVENLFYDEGEEAGFRNYKVFDEYYSVSAQDLNMKLIEGETYNIKYGYLFDAGSEKYIREERKVKFDEANSSIKSVFPLNASQIRIQFNWNIDSSSVSDVANYKIVDENGIIIPIKEVKTIYYYDPIAIITLADPIKRPEKINVTVNGIHRSDHSEDFPAITRQVLVVDGTPPEVVSLDKKYDGSKLTSVEILLSEPIQSGMLIIGTTYIGMIKGEEVTISNLELTAEEARDVYILQMSDGTNINSGKFILNQLSYHVRNWYENKDAPEVIGVSYTRDKKGRVDNITIHFDKALRYDLECSGSYLKAFDDDFKDVSLYDDPSNRISYHSNEVKQGDNKITFPIAEGVDIYHGKYTLMPLEGLTYDESGNKSKSSVWYMYF